MSTTVSNQPLNDYTVAGDVVSGEQFQYVKLVDPTAGSTVGIGTALNPLVVNPSISPAISTLTGLAPVTTTVGTSSATLLAANASRKGLVITLVGTGRIFLSFGANAAIINGGIPLLTAGSVWVMDAYTFSTQAINAIGSAAGITVSIQEFN